jgi:predicted Ser/Thr protein kinase
MNMNTTCKEIEKKISIVQKAISQVSFFGHNSQIYKYKNFIIKEFSDIEKFKKEQTFLKILNGTFISPKIYDSIECGEKFYILMKFIDGLTLEEYCNKGLSFTRKNASKLRQTIDKLHSRGILHNDLHMGNVMVIDKGNGELSFRILDFEQSLFSFNIKKDQDDFYSLYSNVILCEDKKSRRKISSLLKKEFEIDESESDNDSKSDESESDN